jgi:hypothetical protein
MKRSQLLTLIALTGVLFLTGLPARAHGNDHADAKATIGSAKVSVSYNRPSLKGRDLTKMIHPGDLWRMGADVPTTIESDVDLDFGGTRVPKGTHVLLARYVQPGEWTLVVSSKDRMHYEPSAKLAEVPMEVQELKDPVEEMTIQLTNKGGRGMLEVAWGNQRLVASFAPAK